jgi:transglutaminase-like putative cysteine protease
MERRRFLGHALALALPVLPAGALAQQAQQRRLRFTIAFANPLAQPLEQQGFACYLPAQLAPGQVVRDIQASMPHRVSSDGLGHRILELDFERFPALGRKIVSVSATVELGAQDRKEALAAPSEWLRPERFIESGAAEIRGLAAALRRPDEFEGARAIYDWVKGNLAYAGYLAQDFGALHALNSRRGDCTEYADLVVALARANGIPGRMVGGYVLDRDSAPRPQDYHNWAELYLDGAWRLVDAQKENWLAPHEQYIAFRIYRDLASNAVGSAHRYQVRGQLQVAF